MSSKILRVLGTEAALGTSTTNGDHFGNARLVRLANTTTTPRLVTIETAAHVTISTFTINSFETVFVAKSKTDDIFAAAATVKGVKVGF